MGRRESGNKTDRPSLSAGSFLAVPGDACPQAKLWKYLIGEIAVLGWCVALTNSLFFLFATCGGVAKVSN